MHDDLSERARLDALPQKHSTRFLIADWRLRIVGSRTYNCGGFAIISDIDHFGDRNKMVRHALAAAETGGVFLQS